MKNTKEITDKEQQVIDLYLEVQKLFEDFSSHVEYGIFKKRLTRRRKARAKIREIKRKLTSITKLMIAIDKE